MKQASTTPTPATEQPLMRVNGKRLETIPENLYIPPDALHIFLEVFEGPLDLLLYLIKQQNVDILQLPVAAITKQYMQYIEMMQELRLELAAEYLVMAAMLVEIKSQMLLPRQSQEEDEEDPRADLIRRLLEYQRFKEAAEAIGVMSRAERDIFTVTTDTSNLPITKTYPKVELKDILTALQEVLRKVDLRRSHHIRREPLSVRERMTVILLLVSDGSLVPFSKCFTVDEGRGGIIVSLLSLLEMLRSGIIEAVQTTAYGQIYLRGKPIAV